MPHEMFYDRKQIEQVIQKALFCQVAFSVDDQPYVVPMNFGYADGSFYFHSKATGKKLDLMQVNPKVGFNLQSIAEPLHDKEKAENCSMRYVSVVGSGVMTMIEDLAEKSKALDPICEQYHLATYAYAEKMLNALVLIRLDVTEMTGKAANVDCEALFAS